MGMYILFVAVKGPIEPEGFVHHITRFLLAVCLITFSGALIDTVAFLEDELIVYLASATLIAVIVIWCSYRYLNMTLSFSCLAGFVFLLHNIVAWAVIDDWFWTLVDHNTHFALILLVFVWVLVFEAYFFHGDPSWVYREPSMRVDEGERSKESTEPSKTWWVQNLKNFEALGISLVLLGMAVYISDNPIFVYPM